MAERTVMKDPNKIVARCECCDKPVRKSELARGYDHPVETKYRIAIVGGHERHRVLREQ